MERSCWQARAKKRCMGIADLSARSEYRVSSVEYRGIFEARRENKRQCKGPKVEITRPCLRMRQAVPSGHKKAAHECGLRLGELAQWLDGGIKLVDQRTCDGGCVEALGIGRGTRAHLGELCIGSGQDQA